jgi:homoserine dehydrogenase
VARSLVFGSRRPPVFSASAPASIRPIGEIDARYYLRLSLMDRPGVLSRVAQILGANQISIASVLQKEARVGEHVPVIIVTHGAKEKNFGKALEEIDQLDVVGAKTVRLRIVDFR